MPYASAATACAPPMRNSLVTPASSAAAITAGSGRGHTAMISRTPATRAGTAVIRSEEGSGKRPPGHVAADAVERFDALLDGHARRDLQASAARNLPHGDARNMAGRLADGAAHRRRHARRSARISAADTSSGGDTPSNRFANRTSARSPPVRTPSTIDCTRRWNARSARSTRGASRRAIESGASSLAVGFAIPAY